MLELLSGQIVPTLPANAGSPTFLNMLGTVHIISAPKLDPIPVPIASNWCDECGTETVPVPLSNPLFGWISHPCHESECSCCYSVGALCGNCGNVEEHCSCAVCQDCSEVIDADDQCSCCECCSEHCACHTCDTCGDIHGENWPYWISDGDGAIYCGSSCAPESDRYVSDSWGSKYLSPGWVRRGDVLPSSLSASRKDVMADHLRLIDPAQAMADFYLSDYVLAVLPSHLSTHNAGWRDAAILRQDAKTLQDYIVRTCDDAFRDYVFLAIGGEVRHYNGVRNCSDPLPGSRGDAWDYWLAMADVIDRKTLIADAVEVFAADGWSSAYGGEAWRVCAQTLLDRETGKLDPRTFVDRVFSLQHNGGSLLNKNDWNRISGFCTSDMTAIGNAHAARHTDFAFLLTVASLDGISLLERLAGEFVLARMPYADMLEERIRIQDALTERDDSKCRYCYKTVCDCYGARRTFEAKPIAAIHESSRAYWDAIVSTFGGIYYAPKSYGSVPSSSVMSPSEVQAKNNCDVDGCHVCASAAALTGWVSE
jgi:hypothetical protein